MTITELIQQMQMPILSRVIGAEDVSEEICVLMGTESVPAGDFLRVIRADELTECIQTSGESRVCIFCSGVPEQKQDLPRGSSLVCFSAGTAEISIAAQRALLALRRKMEIAPARESLLDRLIEGRLPENEQTEEVLQGLGLNPNRRFCMILVSFFGRLEEINWDAAGRQLGEILHGCPVFEYRGDLVALCTLEKGEISFRCPKEEMEEYLRRQGAYAVISNSAMRATAIRVLYQQSRSAMRFGGVLNKDPSTRVFPFEKYAGYHVVELCANAYRNERNIHNVVYLCHPALGNVMRYDRSHGTNYAEILRKFLENNCNMSQTARNMFMHRNTMLNKLETVRELIGVPLEDPEIREQLQFSFRVVDYAEKILQGRTFRQF